MKFQHFTLLAFAALAVLQPRARGQSPLTVDLGSASNFAVLAASGITVSGAVTITGDIGTFPTTTVTGIGNIDFVSGTNHAGDSFTQGAQSALLAAYNDAAGRTATTSYGAIFDVGGLILTSGVYNEPTSLAITGLLTLDGGGNPNAVWIFQIGSTLTTAVSSQIILENGAQADNVFWQVGNSATLGNSSEFMGTVLAEDSITLGTGATADGGLLAISGATTLDGNDTVAAAIPEPASTTLIIAGFAGLIAGVRRIRRRFDFRNRTPAI